MSIENTLDLPEEISIANITEWKTKFVNFSMEPTPLLLNAERLERVDTAAMQLMLAFVNKARAEDKSITWDKPSSAFLNMAKQLGLTDALQLTEKID
ncbi:MAG: hypothetical protein CSA60_00180 [Neptuniibacter caesariensis]|uniref:MlaB-like STAS domain-containing protein n=1 Tax=Neptuniibacter caesariensis TaxID=207954 RepID=A0A2G6JQ27_NEPCE|nr:MAG: hypothetical protein CSA60_00180 [Neptuniibacter caesariensis]